MLPVQILTIGQISCWNMSISLCERSQREIDMKRQIDMKLLNPNNGSHQIQLFIFVFWQKIVFNQKHLVKAFKNKFNSLGCAALCPRAEFCSRQWRTWRFNPCKLGRRGRRRRRTRRTRRRQEWWWSSPVWVESHPLHKSHVLSILVVAVTSHLTPNHTGKQCKINHLRMGWVGCYECDAFLPPLPMTHRQCFRAGRWKCPRCFSPSLPRWPLPPP